MIRFALPGILVLLMLSASAGGAGRADPAGTDSKLPNLKIGVVIEPPFVILEDDHWAGISIELWEMIADYLGWTWTYAEYDLKGLLKAVESGEIDMAVGAIARTSEREKIMDFTPTYLNTGLALVTHEEPVTSVLDVLSHMGDSAFLQLTVSLVIICVLFGTLMWWAERRQNKDHFGGHIARGFGSGIWWSMVTMSTVGYGDKAPRTITGRGLGLVWIFLSIVLLAAFTGTIASSMTMGRMGTKLSGLEDLRSLVVGALSDSEASLWLTRNNIRHQSFESIRLGLEGVVSGEIDVFVGDRAAAVWRIARFEQDAKLIVQGNLHPERLAYALPTKSPHAESLNVAMLKVLESRSWRYLRTQYGEQQVLMNTLGNQSLR